jgi:hypothetical protein
MEVRPAIARTARKTTLTIVGWAILTLLVSAAISACTPDSTPTSSVTSFEPTVSGSVTVTASPPTSTALAPAAPHTTSPPSPAATITVTVTPPPTAAPVTGGGGTAGLQDGVLFAIGAAAILAGVGSVIYRRKLTKDR